MEFKRYEELQFADDFMFWKVMTEYEDICRKVVELCIGHKVHGIRYKEGQKEMKILPESRGIRLDVYLEDDDRTLCDFEMQKVSGTDLGKRFRYYDSIMTLNALQMGVDYEKLKDSYAVFICLFDPFEKGRVVYEFTKRDRCDHELIMGDGAVDIVINALGDDSVCSDEMKSFLAAVRGQQIESEPGRAIGNAVKRIRERPEWRAEYMLYEIRMNESRKEGYAAGIREGEERGIEQGRLDTLRGSVQNMVDALGITAEEAMDILKVTQEDRALINGSTRK